MTTPGRRLFTRAGAVSLAVEQEFTSALGGRGATQLHYALRTLLAD